MPYYQATIYRKDADNGKRHHLGSAQIEAETVQQVRKQMHDAYWDESMALVGGRLEVEVATLAERLYEANLLLAGPDGSRSLLGEDAVWALDEASAMAKLRDKGIAMLGEESTYLVVEITGERD